jgi:hypothetical protein
MRRPCKWQAIQIDNQQRSGDQEVGDRLLACIVVVGV